MIVNPTINDFCEIEYLIKDYNLCSLYHNYTISDENNINNILIHIYALYEADALINIIIKNLYNDDENIKKCIYNIIYNIISIKINDNDIIKNKIKEQINIYILKLFNLIKSIEKNTNNLNKNENKKLCNKINFNKNIIIYLIYNNNINYDFMDYNFLLTHSLKEKKYEMLFIYNDIIINIDNIIRELIKYFNNQNNNLIILSTNTAYRSYKNYFPKFFLNYIIETYKTHQIHDNIKIDILIFMYLQIISYLYYNLYLNIFSNTSNLSDIKIPLNINSSPIKSRSPIKLSEVRIPLNSSPKKSRSPETNIKKIRKTIINLYENFFKKKQNKYKVIN